MGTDVATSSSSFPSADAIQAVLDRARQETASLLVLLLLPADGPGVYRLTHSSGATAAPVRRAQSLLLRLIPTLGAPAFRIHLHDRPALRTLINGPEVQLITDLTAISEACNLPAAALDVSVKMLGLKAAAVVRFPLAGRDPGFLVFLRREPVEATQLEAWRSYAQAFRGLLRSEKRSHQVLQPLPSDEGKDGLRLPPEYTYDRLRLHLIDRSGSQVEVITQVPDDDPHSLGGPGELLPLAGSAIETAVQTGLPVASADLLTHRRFWSDEVLLAEGFRSVLYWPLRPESGERLVVELASRTPGRYNIGNGGLNGLREAVEALVHELRPQLSSTPVEPAADGLLARFLSIFQQPFEKAFPEAMTLLRGHITWDYTMIELLTPTGDEFELAAVVPPGLFIAGERFSLEGSRLAAAVADAVPTAAPDLAALRPCWTDALLYQQGYRSAAFLPLQLNQQPLGLWTLARKQLHPFTAQELAELGKLAGLIALTVAAHREARSTPAAAQHHELLLKLLRAVPYTETLTEEEICRMTLNQVHQAGIDALLLRHREGTRFMIEINASGRWALGTEIELPSLPGLADPLVFLSDTPEASCRSFAVPITLNEEQLLLYLSSPALDQEDQAAIECFWRYLSAMLAGARLRRRLDTDYLDVERRAAERTAELLNAIRRAEKSKLEALLESVTEGIILVDAELHPLAVNPVARQLLQEVGGVEPDGTIRLDQTPLAPLITEVAADGVALNRELNASEGRRTFAVTVAPLSGSTDAKEIVVTLRDITEERLIQERLLQSEKMASVGQLVSGVAHELNNPLTGILGFAQLLMSRELDERARWEVQTIYSEAERAAKIVQNLLSFARRRRPEKELINVNRLIERVIELRNYELRVNNIDVDLQLDPELPATMADPDQIQQVLFNIIANAEQAMLKAHHRGLLTIKTATRGDTATIRISDDGPGIPPQDLRRVFDPFFTTKGVGEGTGLGLSICYGIIAEHGGRIWAESPPGAGATFVIELPVVKGIPAERPSAEPEPAPAIISTKRILVVDDEETIQDLLAGILTLDGHIVEAAGNGKEALERIQRQQFDLVITDIKMPDLDGPAFYREVKAQKPALADRVIFITGDTVSTQTRNFIQQIGNPCLAKPFKVREVRETVQRLLDQSRQ